MAPIFYLIIFSIFFSSDDNDMHGEKKTVESKDVICWNRDSSFFFAIFTDFSVGFTDCL